MKRSISILLLAACTVLAAADSRPNDPWVYDYTTAVDTSIDAIAVSSVTRHNLSVHRSSYSLDQLDLVISENRNTEFLLGHSKQGRKIHAYYIPGKSPLRALVIGGVHGSELSSVEVAYQLLDQLLAGEQAYYSVMIVPSLFPDNAVKALKDPSQIGGLGNIGRYSHTHAVDPNRQMPTPGKAFGKDGLDHVGRKIEAENRLLLQLITDFKPLRVANIHAIRDPNYGGVYADPRTDNKGIALGYETDSKLALDIARYIADHGGNVAGNKLAKSPTALYYKDPEPVPAGAFQRRNMTGSVLNAKRGSGVSLGTWGSTAIEGESDPSKNRDAMRILTIEYPGYKRPMDYPVRSQQLFQQEQVRLYATAIETYFLGMYYTETEMNSLAVR